jgi:hypothetical protein
MADIAADTQQIRTAIKGKDVREALASGIEDINTEVENTTSRQNTVEQDFIGIQQSEAIREQNETTRQDNETNRQNNETERNAAETLRIKNETTRHTNETTRQNNEVTREANSTNTINAMDATNDAFKVYEPYDNTHTYNQLNKVSYLGSSYCCIVDGTIGILPTTNSNWTLVAAKGSDGLGGDMFKSTYDADNTGIVDNAEKLGGQTPSYYASQSSLDTTNSNLSSYEANNLASFNNINSKTLNNLRILSMGGMA